MRSDPSKFTGDIPGWYDRGLGPNIFTDFGDRLVATCAAENAEHVLEIAAGTGIVSRKLRDRMSDGALLVVSDLNAPMLEIAKAKFGDAEAVEFTVANAQSLDFGDCAFDLLVCQFGVMFFPDKQVSFREAARVLKPGGRYVFNVWDAIDRNPFSKIAHEVAASFFPDDPPGFYKVPFSYADTRTVMADLAAAGWEDVSHESLQIDKQIADVDDFSRALVYGNPLYEEIRERGGVDPDDVVAAIRDALTGALEATGMRMPLSATTFVCRKA